MRSRSLRPGALIRALISLALLGPSATAEAQTEVTRLPVSITVAEHDGEPVVSDAWIEQQIHNANEIFAPARVTFSVARRETTEEHVRMENRRDRHRLGHLIHDHRIDVFVVLSLRDVDEPERMRQGVHWRPRGEMYEAGSHYVIISSIAGPTVLAHELGHFFGNPHSPTPGNIMSYTRGEVPPFFDAPQRERIRFSLRRFLRRDELVALED